MASLWGLGSRALRLKAAPSQFGWPVLLVVSMLGAFGPAKVVHGSYQLYRLYASRRGLPYRGAW